MQPQVPSKNRKYVDMETVNPISEAGYRQEEATIDLGTETNKERISIMKIAGVGNVRVLKENNE